MAALALEYGADDDQAIGALLHDAAEDGGGEATLAEIRARFGDAVGDIVLGCSDSLVEDPEGKLPWLERKENYLAHLEHAGESVLLVSAADKLHNVRSMLEDYRAHLEQAAGPVIKLVELLAASDPARLAQFRREYDALVAPYFENNLVRQDYLLTRAVKN